MKIVFFVEGKSEKEMLNGLLPSIGVSNFQVVPFEGKQDLEKQLPIKLRGWLEPETKFLVLRDQDRGDCKEVKERLKKICEENGQKDAVVRIACRELESWYLGDLLAVENALVIPKLSDKQNGKKYRTPDKLANASEELIKLTNNKYQKVKGSRLIGKFLGVNENKSHSFNVFVESVKRIQGNNS